MNSPLSAESEQPCILCSDKAKKKVIDRLPIDSLIRIYKKGFPDYDFQKEFQGHSGDIELLSCTHCDLRFFSPQVPGSDKFYEYLQQFDWYYSTNKPEFDFSKKYIDTDADVLEIGAGSGFFARNLKCASYTGLEFNDESIRNAAQNGITLIKESIEEHSKKNQDKYDIVCAFQVLEHVGNPGEFIKAAITSLKPGGKLITAIPSADSYAAYFPNHVLNLPPHHVTMWTDKNFHRIAEIFKLDLKQIYHEECDSRQMQVYLYTIAICALNKKLGRSNKTIELSFWSKVKQYAAHKLSLFLSSGMSDSHETFSARGQSVTVVYEKR